MFHWNPKVSDQFRGGVHPDLAFRWRNEAKSRWFDSCFVKDRSFTMQSFFSRGAVNGAKLVVFGCFLREIKFLVPNKVVNRCGGCDFGSTQGGYGQFSTDRRLSLAADTSDCCIPVKSGPRK